MQLRVYQRAAIDAVFSFVSQRDGHPLIVLPTGSGKSLVMGALVAEAFANYPAGRALILAHRKELITQNVRAVATALPMGQIGIYSAGLNRKDTDAQVIVAGIQSMARDPYKLGAFDLACVDEAHLVPETDDSQYRDTVKALLTMNPHLRFVGLTATPFRMASGMLHTGPNALFTDIAYEAPVRELIDGGFLCPLIGRATIAKLSTEGVGTRGGEFIAGQLEKAVDVDDTNRAVVAESIKLLGDRRKWLFFCAGVGHAQHIAELLNDSGIAAAPVHGELDADTRAARLAMFKSGQLRALTSMDVLTTGYDEPAIDAIVLLRPTKSTGLYVQMVGRGFRLHADKQNTLVLDFAGNVARHGPVDEIRVTDRKAAKDTQPGEVPTKECPGCATILHLATRTCHVCGHSFPVQIASPDRTPSDAPVLSTERETEWDDVTDVFYEYHTKRFDPDAPPTMRVEYYSGYHRIASEWICFEHDGYAREKAELWWRVRSTLPVPGTVDQALELAPQLRKPTSVGTVPDGRWTRIVSYRFPSPQLSLPVVGPGPTPNGLPRACWTCGYWTERDKACLLANAVPPEGVQKNGCDSWTEEDANHLVPF